MIKLEVVSNGDLKINLLDKEELEYLLSKELHEEDILTEMMDTARYLGNDWLCNMVIGLTEAPNIGRGVIFDEEDEDENMFAEEIWYYPDYMLKSFANELLENGFVIFKKAD